MLRLSALLVFAIALSAGSSTFADEKKPNFESIFYSGFKTMDSFGLISVSVQGSAEKIGLKKEDLTDFLRLRFKNSFAGIGFKEPKDLWESIEDNDKGKKIGNIHVKVWTVGDDYPIAYHIAINAGNLTNTRQYESSILGYGSKRNVPDSVRESISKLVEDLAVAFFKARNEL
ncbi:MAG: hypothetical protein ACK5OI_11490 [Curvibacter sp.]|jgi:hypothetical protein